MIFLRDHNILFLKPRKVGGTSFEIALTRFAGPNDIVTPISTADEATRTALGFGGPRNHLIPLPELPRLPPRKILSALRGGRARNRFFNHMPAVQARHFLGAEVFDHARKVSIVRNPYDKLVSQYFWETRSLDTKPDFRRWILRNPQMLADNNSQYLIEDQNVIDTYIRYEALEEDIRALEAEVPALAGLYDIFSGLSAKGTIRPREAREADFFAGDASLVETIRFFNRHVVDRFGYVPAGYPSDATTSA